MYNKIKKGIRSPQKVPPYLLEQVCEYTDEVRIRRLRSNVEGDRYIVDLDGFSLAVDPFDDGISRDLILHKEREPISSAAYKKELEKIDKRSESKINVAEVGANIGYYAMISATSLSNSHIFAAEPIKKNVDYLTYNVQLNGLEDRFHIDNVAIGSETKSKEIHVATDSNCSSLQDNLKEQYPERVKGKTETKVLSTSDWLQSHDLGGNGIDILRMDVEGYESEVLRGLPKSFGRENDVLLHIELHPKFMDDAEYDYVRDFLSDVRIVKCARGDTELNVSTIDEAMSYPWIELVGYY